MRRRLASVWPIAWSLSVGLISAAGGPPLSVPASVAVSAAAPAPAVAWRVPEAGWGEPASDGAVAYFLTRAHEVLAVDAETGAIRWRRATGGVGDVPTGTQVRLAGRLVLVGDGGGVAIEKRSGEVAWRFDAPDGDDAGLFLGASDADLVVAGSPAGRIYAIAAATGTLRWQRDVVGGERRVVFPPIQAGPLLVATFTSFDGPLRGGVVSIDRGGGRRWIRRFADGAGAAGPPLVVGDDVVVARTDGRIDAVATATGRPRWTIAAEHRSTADARDIRALACGDGVLVATSVHGPVRGFDARSHRLRWQFTNAPADAVALRARALAGTLYLPYSDGTLVALDLRTGQERWRTDAARSIDWPPAATAAAVFAAGADALWALRPEPIVTPRPTSATDTR